MSGGHCEESKGNRGSRTQPLLSDAFMSSKCFEYVRSTGHSLKSDVRDKYVL